MKNVFGTFFRVIKQKFGPVINRIQTKLRLSAIKSKVRTKLSKFLTQRMNFKPKDKDDYYQLGRWMISKKLALFLVLIMGVAGLYYYIFISPVSIFSKSNDNIRVYDYDSMALRFISGQAKIRSKRGDIAYVGEVSKGAANGQGILYYEDGYKNGKGDDLKLYEGEFVNNQYQGKGTKYSKEGTAEYQGEFSMNEREGKGTKYRANGSVEYVGEFRDDHMEGQGALYDNSNNKIYEGIFSKDHLIYESILDKTSQEISEIYFGNRKIYYDEEQYMVLLEEIDALYSGMSNDNTLNEEINADRVYVMNTACYLQGSEYGSIADLKEKFGQPDYEGNSYINLEEKLAILNGEKTIEAWGKDIQIDFEETLENVYNVGMNARTNNPEEMVYIYVFEIEKIQYTFYCTDKNKGFVMYQMQNCK